jgi:hypothetical protein
MIATKLANNYKNLKKLGIVRCAVDWAREKILVLDQEKIPREFNKKISAYISEK